MTSKIRLDVHENDAKPTTTIVGDVEAAILVIRAALAKSSFVSIRARREKRRD